MPDKCIAIETTPPNEGEFIKALSARLKAKIVKDHVSGIMRRDAHPKMHGLVKAEFIINANTLDQDLRVGLFKESKSYKAWIRFSNQDGEIKPDIGRDIRGVAIKLMGVPGEKILTEEKDEETHDFILISTNVFVTKNIEDFDGLIKSITGNLLLKLCFFVTHWRVLWNVLKSMKKFANPLQIRYFSTTPYLFGKYAVKYALTPQNNNTDTIPKKPSDDFLRIAMIKQLQNSDVYFDFSVQFQMDVNEMPIEDAGKLWQESKSPFIKVATIRILKQEFNSDDQNKFGENLSFTPWHALPEHRPLGGINRGRKIVYQLISQFRHEFNKTPRKEPHSWYCN